MIKGSASFYAYHKIVPWRVGIILHHDTSLKFLGRIILPTGAKHQLFLFISSK